jgi:phage gp36-like protein
MPGLFLKRLDDDAEIRLAYREPVTGVDVSVDPQGLVDGGAPVVVTHAIAGNAVTLTIAGGTDGERYVVRAIAEHADGSAEQDFELAVIDPAWTMPGGAAPWIDLHEFVQGFGYDEAVRATDADGSRTIDRAFLIGKLRDAQASAEIYVAARYAIPLVTVPAMLKTAVADLAAARLYRNGAPQHIADQAKAATRQLEQISQGKLPLPLPVGETAAPAESDAPISFFSGGRAYPDGLADY